MASDSGRPAALTRRVALWGAVAGGSGQLQSVSYAETPGAKMNFVSDAAGSVKRSVEEKLRELPSLDDFGTIGDGKTDDWAGVQAALNWAGSRPGARLRVPPRVFAVSRPLLVPESIELLGEVSGDGNKPLSGFRALKGFETPHTMILAEKGIKELMPIAAVLVSKQWSEGASFARRLNIRDIYIDVDAVTERRGGPVHGLMLANQQIDLFNLWIRSATGFGVWINTQLPDGSFTGALVDNVLRRVWVRGAGVGAATFKTAAGVFRYGGFHIGALPGARDPAGASEPPLATDGIMDYCTVAVGPEDTIGCRGNGIHITRSAGWRLTSCHLNGAGRHGVVLERAFQTEISGCYIDGWGVDADAQEGTFGSIWCNAIVGLDEGADGGIIVSSNRISFRPVRQAAGNRFAAFSLRAGMSPAASAVVSGNVVIKRRGADEGFAVFDFARAEGGELDAVVTGNIAPAATTALLDSWNESDVRPRFSGNSFQFAEKPPKSGWFPAGVKIDNIKPAPGGMAGWVCVKSGNPATWRGYGRIEK